MADVRKLFLGGLKLRNVLVICAALLLAALGLMKADLKSLLLKAYGTAMAVFAALLVFLGVAFRWILRDALRYSTRFFLQMTSGSLTRIRII